MRVVLAMTAQDQGGTWRHVRDLGVELRARGHDVLLALRPDAAPLQAAAARAELDWLPLRRSLALAADVWHLHLHDTYDRLAPALLAARRPRAGTRVVTEHLPRSNASDPRLLPAARRRGATRAKSVFKRIEARLVDRMIAVSAGSQRFLRARYGLPPQLVRVIPNGITVGADPGPPLPGEELRVVSLGALGVQKGHDVLIEAGARSPGGWTAQILGTGSGRPQLEARAAALTPGRIVVDGWSDDPSAVVLGADVMCLPSRWEAFPYAALEAMALGRPVVASRVDGLEEIVAHGETGLLVPPEDPDALASALDMLAAAPERAAEMGRAAHARVAAEFSLERMVSSTLAVYRGEGPVPA